MMPLIGDVHVHSIMSGHAYGTIRELAAAAAERGLQILGITEHGPGIPGTVDPIYFRNLMDAPRILSGVQMLYGCEVNLLPGGALSLDRKNLTFLDYAAVGIHKHCYENAGAAGNTDNMIRAMAEPKVRFITHPDDNQFPLDPVALVQGAKAFGVALEVNNSSLRKPRIRWGCEDNYRKLIPLCMEYGVPILVNSDAHDPVWVGEFSLAEELLESLGVEESLILNNDAKKLSDFLLRQSW